MATRHIDKFAPRQTLNGVIYVQVIGDAYWYDPGYCP
jgi:hypothetical protein